jgi:hypothetical protein
LREKGRPFRRDEVHESKKAKQHHENSCRDDRPVSVSFTTGEGTVYTGFIKDIKQVQDGSRTLYTLVYDVDGTRNEPSFYKESGIRTGSSICFKNQQKIIWRKSEGS